MEEEDPEGISTSGQVDDEGLLREEPALFNNEDDEDEDCPNDGYDDDDDDEEEEEEEEEDREEDGVVVAAGPSRDYPARGNAQAANASPPLAHDVPAGSIVVGRPEISPPPPAATENHQEQPAVGLVNGVVGSAGFKKPFNKKERLLETQQQQQQCSSGSGGPNTSQSSSASSVESAAAAQPGPSSALRPPVNREPTAGRTTAAAAGPLANLISMELRRPSGGSSSSNSLVPSAGASAAVFSSASSSLAPATLSVLTSGLPGTTSSCSYYTSTGTPAKTVPAFRSTPSVSLFPVDNHHNAKMIYPYQQSSAAATQQSQGLRDNNVNTGGTAASAGPSAPAASCSAAAVPVSSLLSAPEKSYSASLGIGLAFSRLPGSSSSNQLPTADAAAAAVLVSGPLSKRLRTRHYQVQYVICSFFPSFRCNFKANLINQSDIFSKIMMFLLFTSVWKQDPKTQSYRSKTKASKRNQSFRFLLSF
jgi:hypothetical protein